MLSVEQGEGLQVLKYQESEKYEPHYDYFHDAYNTKNGGQRIATVLMYLWVSLSASLLALFTYSLRYTLLQ